MRLLRESEINLREGLGSEDERFFETHPIEFPKLKVISGAILYNQ